MTAIIDYGVGNLFSLKSSLAYIGADCVVTSDPAVIKKAPRIILPGVGAFEDAAAKLRATGLDELLKEEAKNGKYIMGICLGMQMLFEKSYEFGCHKGLGLIPGEVVPLLGAVPSELKIPQMGWNSLDIKGSKDDLYKYTENGTHVYFVHSYYAKTDSKYITATSEYGIDVTASAKNGRVMGTQYHPEKSGKHGLEILKAFTELK
ncbi:MAG: imidazole glycerol phosphate synthase subunit HisH [Clostridia bacterium]|nr:imidazole glycerol phosphate synthase subunit HisH [Clostridia bacterium]